MSLCSVWNSPHVSLTIVGQMCVHSTIPSKVVHTEITLPYSCSYEVQDKLVENGTSANVLPSTSQMFLFHYFTCPTLIVIISKLYITLALFYSRHLEFGFTLQYTWRFIPFYRTISSINSYILYMEMDIIFAV